MRGERVTVVQGAPVPGRGDLALCVAVLPLSAQLPRGRGADAPARRHRLLRDSAPLVRQVRPGLRERTAPPPAPARRQVAGEGRPHLDAAPRAQYHPPRVDRDQGCHLSYFGSPAHPGSSAGSDTGAASIGSGSVHVTAHAFHPARPSANRVRVRTRLPARPRQVSALQHLAGGCVLSSWRTSRQRSRTPGCPDPVSYGLMSRPPTVRNGSHRTRRCRRYGRKI